MSKDFRVGDVVCCSHLGTGKVTSITQDNTYSVGVCFENEASEYFEPIGNYCYSDIHPALFHGTWEEVFGNVKDVLPKRKKKVWVNLYAPNGLNGGSIETGDLYDSEIAAINMKGADPAYLKTVEFEIDE